MRVRDRLLERNILRADDLVPTVDLSADPMIQLCRCASRGFETELGEARFHVCLSEDFA